MSLGRTENAIGFHFSGTTCAAYTACCPIQTHPSSVTFGQEGYFGENVSQKILTSSAAYSMKQNISLVSVNFEKEGYFGEKVSQKILTSSAADSTPSFVGMGPQT